MYDTRMNIYGLFFPVFFLWTGGFTPRASEGPVGFRLRFRVVIIGELFSPNFCEIFSASASADQILFPAVTFHILYYLEIMSQIWKLWEIKLSVIMITLGWVIDRSFTPIAQ